MKILFLMLSLSFLSFGCTKRKTSDEGGKLVGTLDGYYDGQELSSSMKRYIQMWNQQESRENEFYSSFEYSSVNGLGYERGIHRRDPSTIIKVKDRYYVWYTRTPKNMKVVGYDLANREHASVGAADHAH